MKTKKITITDLSKDTGLSISTISRALKDHPDITDKTKRIVRDAAQIAGYQPNVFAQNFKNNRSNIIGIIVPDMARPYYSSIISGLQERATDQKFFVVTCQSKDSFISEIKALQTLIGLNVDAIAIVHSKETSHFSEFKKIVQNGIPLLAIDRSLEGIEANYVSNDQFVAGFMMGEHLGKSGFKRVAILGGPKDLMMSQQRIDGCIAGLKAANVTVHSELIFHCDFHREREVAVVGELLESEQRPDAIFSIYDRGAVEILQHLKLKHIDIPNDIAVAGCGNDPYTGFLSPSLTTIDLCPHRLGELAAEILINEIIMGRNSVPTQNILRPRLVVRESTLKTNYNR